MVAWAGVLDEGEVRQVLEKIRGGACTDRALQDAMQELRQLAGGAQAGRRAQIRHGMRAAQAWQSAPQVTVTGAAPATTSGVGAGAPVGLVGTVVSETEAPIIVVKLI